MRLLSLSSHFPDQCVTQGELLQVLQSSTAYTGLKQSSKTLVEKILLGDSGINQRGFSVPDLAGVFTADAGQLNRWHEQYATELSTGALRRALAEAQLEAEELDAIIICSCTGYLCPGVSSYVAEAVRAAPDIYLQDMVGLGCGAALPTLRAGHGFLAANPQAKVAVIAVEVCSAAFYISDDPGVLISLCLFGDGASASIWDGSMEGGLILGQFDTVHQPEHREKVRFENEEGYLKNKLHRTVPELSSSAVKTLWERRGEADTPAEVDEIISHGGGKAVIQALRESIPAHSFSAAESVLRNHGNMSSPSVLVALEEQERIAPRQSYWLTSFGAGFAAHSATLQRVP